MADQQQGGQGAQGKKILGMPRTTGLIVIALGAVVAGYFVISRFTSSSKSAGGSGPGGGQGGGYGGYGPGPGHVTIVRVWRDWQGHRPRPAGGAPGHG